MNSNKTSSALNIALTAEQTAVLETMLRKHEAEQKRKEAENEAEERARLEAVARSAAKNSTAGQTRGAKTKGRGTAPAAPTPGEKPSAAPAAMVSVWTWLCQEAGLSPEEKAQRFAERLARATAYRAASRYFGQRPGEGPGGRMGLPQGEQDALLARRQDEAEAIRQLIGVYYPGEPHGVQLAAADSAVRSTLAKANGTIGALLSPRERSKALASLRGFAPGMVNSADKTRADLLARRQAQSEIAGNAAARYENEPRGTVLSAELRKDWLAELARLEAIEDDMLKMGLSSKCPGLSL